MFSFQILELMQSSDFSGEISIDQFLLTASLWIDNHCFHLSFVEKV